MLWIEWSPTAKFLRWVSFRVVDSLTKISKVWNDARTHITRTEVTKEEQKTANKTIITPTVMWVGLLLCTL